MPNKDDPKLLSWLLEPDNPSVRYWTLVELMDRDQRSEDVREAKAEIGRLPVVSEILALQSPEGHWGKNKADPYRADGTIGVLLHLHALGVPVNSRIRAGCDSLLQNAQHIDGGLSMVKARRSGIAPCTTGELLHMLCFFDMLNDERVHKAYEYMTKEMNTERALRCRRYDHQECLWGAIAALKGFACLPEQMRTKATETAIRKLTYKLLNANLDFGGEHKRWLSFKVPQGWDLLAAIWVLGLHGCASDPRMLPLIERGLEVRDPKGRWICRSTTKNWPLDRRGQPSKWVTFYGLRALKAIR